MVTVNLDKQAHGGGERGTALPACQAIADDLRAKVVIGNLKPGTQLPSHRQLAAAYHVTLGTVQQAVARLVSEGVLATQANRGLYVASPTVPLSASSRFDRFVAIETDTPIIAAHVGIVSPLATLWDETLTIRLQNPTEPRPPTIEALERTVADFGGSTSFRDTGGHKRDLSRFTRNAVKQLVEEGVDAITLVFMPDEVIVNDVLPFVDAARIPVVLAVSERCRVPLPRVCYDGRVAAFKAADHLLGQGCQRLVFFAPFRADWSDERLNGVRDAVRLRGRAPDSVVSYINDMAMIHAMERYDQLALAEGYAAPHLTEIVTGGIPGVIAHNDHAATGFIQAAAKQGLVAGKDYLIVGFDDGKNSRMLGLSSMRPPFSDMGRECANLTMQALTAQVRTSKQISLHSHLMIRASSRNEVKSKG